MEQDSLFVGDEYKYLILDSAKKSLNDMFLIPPFSTFDTRQGYWQDRKDKWKALGIKSELGRDAQTFHMKEWADKKGESGDLKGNNLPSDTSIFDPVLCEICYKWFNVQGGGNT